MVNFTPIHTYNRNEDVLLATNYRHNVFGRVLYLVFPEGLGDPTAQCGARPSRMSVDRSATTSLPVTFAVYAKEGEVLTELSAVRPSRRTRLSGGKRDI